jgi:ribose transport system permease protein
MILVARNPDRVITLGIDKSTAPVACKFSPSRLWDCWRGPARILYASRIATATSTVGAGAELQAITAVILGGASLWGGRDTIWGALIGVFFMGLMKNVLIISRFSSEWQGIVLGAVLVAAVAVDSLMNGRRAS